jgi:hypothetical protein
MVNQTPNNLATLILARDTHGSFFLVWCHYFHAIKGLLIAARSQFLSFHLPGLLLLSSLLLRTLLLRTLLLRTH